MVPQLMLYKRMLDRSKNKTACIKMYFKKIRSMVYLPGDKIVN